MVEKYYSNGVYIYISKILRFSLGWLPFSLGDLLYLLLIGYLMCQMIKLIKNFRKLFNPKNIKKAFVKIMLIGLIVYVVFYGFWGLNYSRVGISGQLHLDSQNYSAQDLDTLVDLLQKKLNTNASLLTPAMRDSFRRNQKLFAGATRAYQLVENQHPFLKYKVSSVKPLFSAICLTTPGYQGYYNPFTGEAQVNTTIPQCVEPFVASHEIAHQLGYAKENEANFVGYLVSSKHPSVNFRYSVYFDMYNYSIGELYYADSTKAKNYNSALHPQVIKDIDDYRAFYERYKNPVEPLLKWVYSHFLMFNNQPSGMESYSEVTRWLIAYYKNMARSRFDWES
ncbi:MAG: DUF3810 domain-containing protein [Sphingobacteriales bacterium]|nr:DUF3810 domain-containing protein [Sphingobacteriales bacterium]